jgi:AraC family transcriptional activator of pobA
MNLAKNKLQRFGLYGERDFLLPDFMHCESIEYRSKKNNWRINAHLHANLFQLFVVESGKITFIFNDRPFKINSASIVCIPENTLHALEVNKNIRGMVLTISTSFLETFFTSAPNVLIEVSGVNVLQHLQKEKLYQLAVQMIHQIHLELQEDLHEKALMLQSYFSLLLCSTYRLSIKHTEKLVPADTQAAQYFRKFYRSVKQS